VNLYVLIGVSVSRAQEMKSIKCVVVGDGKLPHSMRLQIRHEPPALVNTNNLSRSLPPHPSPSPSLSLSLSLSLSRTFFLVRLSSDDAHCKHLLTDTYITHGYLRACDWAGAVGKTCMLIRYKHTDTQRGRGKEREGERERERKRERESHTPTYFLISGCVPLW
jgi:hypothetical protein